MEFVIRLGCQGVDWQAVSDTLKAAGISYRDGETHRRAFEASHTSVFIYAGDRLIGLGRALSDGQYQAAVYDCAVHPDFQGKGVGSLIVEQIITRLSHCNIILYASPGKEGFYQKHQFRRMKTGMALFTDQQAKLDRGFIE